MPRNHSLFVVSLMLGLLGVIGSARAQQMTMSVTEVEDRPTTVSVTNPINSEECSNNKYIELLFMNVLSTARLIDVWRGSDCSAANRASTTTSEATCKHLFSFNTEGATQVRKQLGVADLLPCEAGSNQMPILWFYATTIDGTTEDVAATAYVKYTMFTVDNDPPSAPTEVEGGEGNTSVPIDWTKSSASDLNGYRVVVEPITDPNASDCSGSSLVSGQAIPAGSHIGSTVANGAVSTTIDPTDYDIDVGGYAAIAVVAEDKALNLSLMSNIGCIHRVDTDGFWDRYESGGGDAKTCSVSAPGAHGRELGALLTVALVFALVILRRNRKHNGIIAALLGASALLFASQAQAYDASSEVVTDERGVESPEHFALELRGGGLTPRVGNSSFRETFGDSALGPLLQGEFDVMVYRIPYFGPLYLGGAAGHAGYSARAYQVGGSLRVDETTKLDLYPLSALVVLRVDVLARQFGLPFVFTGKFGPDFTIWTAYTGSQRDARGFDVSLRWGAQLGFELDFFDRAAARALDEAWGLNHAFLFGEVLGNFAVSDRPLVKNTFGWVVGLGFTL